MDENDTKDAIRLWYNKLANNGIIPVYEARNKIIDIDELGEESLEYYHYHSKINTMKKPCNSDQAFCCKESMECIHKYDYFGCDGCSVKIENDMRHPPGEPEDTKRRRKQ